MVGLQSLDLPIGVRIPVSQILFIPSKLFGWDKDSFSNHL